MTPTAVAIAHTSVAIAHTSVVTVATTVAMAPTLVAVAPTKVAVAATTVATAPTAVAGTLPGFYSEARASMTCSSWPSTLTFFHTLRTLPSPSITKVERWIPMEVLPYMFFSRQAP